MSSVKLVFVLFNNTRSLWLSDNVARRNILLKKKIILICLQKSYLIHMLTIFLWNNYINLITQYVDKKLFA